jgi:Protein of unknown function (DUF3168)
VIPPIYNWLVADSQITAIVGDRIYGSGVASQEDGAPEGPHIVYQIIAKDSPMYLGRYQDHDYDRVQIHCWSYDEAQAGQLANLCRSALNPYGNLVGGAIADQDFDTRMYRCGFDFGGWRDI